MTRLLAAFAASAAVGVSTAFAQFDCPGAQSPWDGQGPFVEAPAAIVGAPVASLAGTGLALAMIPFDLADYGIRGPQGRQDETIPKFAKAGLCAGAYLGVGVSTAAGLPFRILKLLFWDGPKRLIAPAPPRGPS